MIWNTLSIVSLLTLTISGIESANPMRFSSNNGSLSVLSKTNKSSAEINSLLMNSTSELQTIQFRKIHIDEEESSKNNAELNNEDDDKIIDLNNLKYDVEILQPGRMEKEDLEIEERFKGPSLNFNTDEFFEENIEVNSQGIQQGHVLLTIGLLGLAFVSIGIYAALVMWRSNLEKRYGMRQRLMTDDDFCTNIPEVRPY